MTGEPVATDDAEAGGRAAYLRPAEPRAPQVDPDTGRVEEIPNTERLDPAPVSPPPSPEAQAALDRLSGAITAAAARGTDDEDRARLARDVFRRADAPSLEGMLRDLRLLAGTGGADDAAAALDAAREATTRWGGRLPNDRQTAAIERTLSASPAPAQLTWNPLRGTPREIEGAFAIARGADRASVAAAFAADARGDLGALLDATAADALEPVLDMQSDHDHVERYFFRRLHHGVPVMENGVVVDVTLPSHPWGGGVVTHAWITWERDVAIPAPSEWMTEAAARAIGARELVSLRRDARLPTGDDDPQWTTRSYVYCAGEAAARACAPVVEVTTHQGGLAAPDGVPDTVLVDALDGSIRLAARMRANYTGSVDIVSHFPYDGADVARDYRRAKMLSGNTSQVAYTDDFGNYDWTPTDGSTWAWVGLDSAGAGPAHAIRHVQSYDCAAAIEPLYASFGLGGTDFINPSPSNFSFQRHDHLTYGWLHWLRDVRTDLQNYVEMPRELRYDVAYSATGGAQFRGCNGAPGVEIGLFGVGLASDSGTPKWNRPVIFHEAAHSLGWCTQTWGAGCGWVTGTRRAFGGSWVEGNADTFSMWANGYETNNTGHAASRDTKFLGIEVPNDIMLYDAEIQGTNSPSTGCTRFAHCNFATEACWLDAHDRARCMKRATTPCTSQFPDQPYVDTQPYGRAPDGDEIPICVSNDYANGRIWAQVLDQLNTTTGWRLGVRALLGANRYYTTTTEFTQTAENYHALFAQLVPRFEVSDVFHTTSAESFAWLDDVTDRRENVELLRPIRDTTRSFAVGGGSGAALSFQTASDEDLFLLEVGQGKSYTVAGTSGGASVDLCLQLLTVGGAVVATSPGCTNGAGTPALRNATLTFSGLTQDRYILRAFNVLAVAGGTYSFTVTQNGDDHPDQLAHALHAEPFRRDGAFMTGRLDATSDLDLFRYDQPPGAAGGALTFTISGVSPAPSLSVWFTTGTTLPSGAPIATGNGSVTVASTSAGRYYVRVASTGGTGSYTLSRTSTCGTCNFQGSYAAPLALPTTSGGFVWDRLDYGAFSPGYNVFDCMSGGTCDWYGIDLAAGEHVSIHTYDVFDALCAIEVGVYAPPEMEYFKGGSTDRYAAAIDKDGAIESNGAALNFVAPRAGTYRIRVRANGTHDCPRYTLGVLRLPVETNALPLAPH
jgi:hypothetical protein